MEYASAGRERLDCVRPRSRSVLAEVSWVKAPQRHDGPGALRRRGRDRASDLDGVRNPRVDEGSYVRVALAAAP